MSACTGSRRAEFPTVPDFKNVTGTISFVQVSRSDERVRMLKLT